jgi:AcrR family transcriptional regulator
MRDAIIRAAVEAFSQYGYRKTTLQDVAGQVGLTRTGLLHHFQSKEGLFLAAIVEGRKWAERQARDSAEAGGLAELRALRRFLPDAEDAVIARFVQTLQAEALHADAPHHVVNFANDRLEQIRSHVAECLEAARDTGQISVGDIPTQATMITGLINGLQIHSLLDPSLDAAAALDGLIDLLEAAPDTVAQGR